MDLLTTYTHDSELQAITVLSLISTIHKSLQAKSSQSSLVVSWQRLLTMEILQLPALRSCCPKPSVQNSAQLSTQLQRHVFLASLAELNCSAKLEISTPELD
jgi:hypothetical protein